MARAKRYDDGGMVGSTYPFPQNSGSMASTPTSNTVVNVGGQTAAETSNNPFTTPATPMRKGGFVRAADGIAKRGKTRGKMR